MRKIFKTEDGIFIKFLKICFLILTFIYCYLSISVIMNWLRPPVQALPSAVSGGTMWLFYTIGYLIFGALLMSVWKIVRLLKKKFQ